MKEIAESVFEDILMAHAIKVIKDLQKAGFKFIDEDDIEVAESEVFDTLDMEIRNLIVNGQLVSHRQ